MTTNPRPAARVVSPGQILTRELEARDWTQRDLATIIGRPYQAVNEIINGSKQITPDTARELARAFDTSIDFWMNLESNYRLHLAEQNNKEQEIARRSFLYNIAPVREMIKRSWINGSNSIDELEKQLCFFFDVPNLNKPLGLTVSFRHSDKVELETAAQSAWVQQVVNISKKQHVAKYSLDRLNSVLPEILELSKDKDAISKVPDVLLECGIHFIVLPHLPHTYIDGAAIVANKNPIIALTLRYSRLDSFWFTLIHEISHIVLGHKGVILDDAELGIGSAGKKEEDEANNLASELLVDQKIMGKYISNVKPYFSKDSIEKFASEVNRHPAIILGQLQRKKVVEYKHLRNLLVDIKPYLSEWTYN